MDPIISVIIPVYNVEPYIRQCLDSIINQTYRNLEIIVIDDGSPDSCGKICDEYAAKDDRVIVIHKQNKGLSAAWNDGMRRATGEWITFIDSDDWVDIDYFEKIMAQAREIGILDADVIIAGGKIEEKEKSNVVRNFTKSAQFSTPEERDYLKIRIHVAVKMQGGDKLSYLGYPWDKFFRLSFIKEHNIWYDESMKSCADMLFNYQAIDMARTVIGCNYYGYHYRFITNGISKKYTPDRPVMFHNYIDKLYSYINAHGGTTTQIVEAINAGTIGYIANSLQTYYFHPQNQDGYKIIAKNICKMKKMPRYEVAIHSSNNRYLGLQTIALKYALRLPWVWPIKILYRGKELLSRK